MAFLPIEIDIRPFTANAAILRTSTFKLAAQLGDMTVPLTFSIKNVVIPSMIRNFAKAGRPPWPPLAESTIAYRLSKEGRLPRPLIRTELLARMATSFPIWRITRDSADMEALDGVVPYAKYHQNGTRYIPARPFALLQPQDIEAIVRIFDIWIMQNLNNPQFWPFSR